MSSGKSHFLKNFVLNSINTKKMAKEIKTEIVIKGSKEHIWEVLTDFGEYPTWNPFIRSIEGKLEEGCFECLSNLPLVVRIVPPGSKGMTFKPTIIELEKYTKLSWLGQFIFKGLFDGMHQFELIDNLDGTTTFIQSEIFRGFLLPFLGKKFQSNTKKGFELMNQKLKERVEESGRR